MGDWQCQYGLWPIWIIWFAGHDQGWLARCRRSPAGRICDHIERICHSADLRGPTTRAKLSCPAIAAVWSSANTIVYGPANAVVRDSANAVIYASTDAAVFSATIHGTSGSILCNSTNAFVCNSADAALYPTGAAREIRNHLWPGKLAISHAGIYSTDVLLG
jgi:hypothetical protein